MNDREPRPLSAGEFRVEIEGVPAAGFSACRGLGGRTRFLEVREGGAEAPRLFADERRWEPIRLERGHADDSRLWEWFRSGAARNGAIILLAPDGSEACRWTFERGRASRWWGPELEAAAERIAIEAVEIVHEGVRCAGA